MSHFPVSASASALSEAALRWCSGLTEDTPHFGWLRWDPFVAHAVFFVFCVGKSEFSQCLFFKMSLAFFDAVCTNGCPRPQELGGGREEMPGRPRCQPGLPEGDPLRPPQAEGSLEEAQGQDGLGQGEDGQDREEAAIGRKEEEDETRLQEMKRYEIRYP